MIHVIIHKKGSTTTMVVWITECFNSYSLVRECWISLVSFFYGTYLVVHHCWPSFQLRCRIRCHRVMTRWSHNHPTIPPVSQLRAMMQPQSTRESHPTTVSTNNTDRRPRIKLKFPTMVVVVVDSWKWIRGQVTANRYYLRMMVIPIQPAFTKIITMMVRPHIRTIIRTGRHRTMEMRFGSLYHCNCYWFCCPYEDPWCKVWRIKLPGPVW